MAQPIFRIQPFATPQQALAGILRLERSDLSAFLDSFLENGEHTFAYGTCCADGGESLAVLCE